MSKHTYADSTLKSWTKDELIHQMRILERNLAVKQELVNNQAKLLKTWAPVVHAHWKGYHTQEPYCSNCGFSYDHEQGEDAQTTDYCGNCGAKMDENEVENLKRCSCGDRYYYPEVEKDENGKWFIRCQMCCKIVWGSTIGEAADAWNRRANTNESNS